MNHDIVPNLPGPNFVPYGRIVLIVPVYLVRPQLGEVDQLGLEGDEGDGLELDEVPVLGGVEVGGHHPEDGLQAEAPGALLIRLCVQLQMRIVVT